MKLTFLGFNSATPTANSHPTSQLLKIKNNYFLIDCGEGTQQQLRKAKLKFSKIDNVFISHLHGDHVFGLIGLISSFGLLGRDKPLTIFGPLGIKELIEVQLKLTQAYRTYEIIYNELTSKKSELIFESKDEEVWTIPLNHRIYCNGYLFKEKIGLRKLNIEKINEIPEIEICDYVNLKNGKDFKLKSGEIIQNEILTYSPEPPKAYAFCSDTMFFPEIIPIIKDVDCLYHEATFENSYEYLSKKTGHSTAQQAAEIAKLANVKKLYIGHFSSRYKNHETLLKEAREVFPNSYLPVELLTIEI